MNLFKSLSLGAFLLTVLVLATRPVHAGECPSATTVTKLPTIEKHGPFDPKSVTNASATYTDKGLVVFLSNATVDAKKSASRLPLPPVTGKGNIAVALTFQNKEKIIAGTYAPNRFGKPMNLRNSLFFGFAAGGMMGSFSANAGQAQITELSDGKVCGTVDIQGTDGAVTGKFTAGIVK